MSTTTTTTTDRDATLLAVSPGSAPDLAAHLAAHGPLAISDHPDWRAATWRAVAESGLLGRGGASFPVDLKWDSVRRAERRPMVVVNAMEGEPVSAKDGVLLGRAAHLVLDGAEVTAAVVGTTDVVVCVAHSDGRSAAAVEAAWSERCRAGTARCRLSIARPPGRYVAGEESALVGWLGSRRPLPVFRTDKSRPPTLGRRPVLVHNAETMAQIALVARHGPAWFRRRGTDEAPGTSLVTLSGAVRAPGVVEVEFGTPVADILGRAGADDALSGVLVGGYGGSWLHPSRLDTPYSPDALAAAGVAHGVGILVALPSISCGLAESARIARYLAGESAGQCGPCVFGLPAIADDLERLRVGVGGAGLVERIERRAGTVAGRGACRHPDGAVRLVRSALEVFADDVRRHADGRPCAGHDAATLLPFPDRPPDDPGRSS
ncbi:MAG: NADH-ubiquinone oxidoreductase-F iron-sulfur binding region domain-containing protein [Acidimicrobiales bacterium]